MRNYLDQFSPWVCLWGLVFIVNVEPSLLWTLPFPRLGWEQARVRVFMLSALDHHCNTLSSCLDFSTTMDCNVGLKVK